MKTKTYEQLVTAQERAVRFAENVLEDSDLADELEGLTVEEYAERKKIEIAEQNPKKYRVIKKKRNGFFFQSESERRISSAFKEALQQIYGGKQNAIDDAVTLGFAAKFTENQIREKLQEVGANPSRIETAFIRYADHLSLQNSVSFIERSLQGKQS